MNEHELSTRTTVVRSWRSILIINRAGVLERNINTSTLTGTIINIPVRIMAESSLNYSKLPVSPPLKSFTVAFTDCYSMQDSYTTPQSHLRLRRIFNIQNESERSYSISTFSFHPSTMAQPPLIHSCSSGFSTALKYDRA
jgi:hypothetical protein